MSYSKSIISIPKKKSYLKFINIIVGSQIVAQTQVEKGDGPNKPSTINL